MSRHTAPHFIRSKSYSLKTLPRSLSCLLLFLQHIKFCRWHYTAISFHRLVVSTIKGRFVPWLAKRKGLLSKILLRSKMGFHTKYLERKDNGMKWAKSHYCPFLQLTWRFPVTRLRYSSLWSHHFMQSREQISDLSLVFLVYPFNFRKMSYCMREF